MDDIEPYRIDVPEQVLDDLRERLARTRFPAEIADAGWDYGTDATYLRELVDYWHRGYDWRARERWLNSFPHFRTEIDGAGVHFLHLRSPEPDALPLILVHGWPGSVVEFLEVLGPLSDPRSHGGDPRDAFHVVCPSIPGYALSGPTRERGWDPRRIARAFAVLMTRLGYDRYGAQGGDWGSVISAQLAVLDEAHVAGLHLNMFSLPLPEGLDAAELSEEDRRRLARTEQFRALEAAYAQLQATKPHTLGIALEDSPAGLAAWFVEKFRSWSDSGGDIETSFTKDQLLDNIMLYWISGTATSAARLYYERRVGGPAYTTDRRVNVPTAIAAFPAEILGLIRASAEPMFEIRRWTEMPRGGHFAAFEEPHLFVDDVRAFFHDLRGDAP